MKSYSLCNINDPLLLTNKMIDELTQHFSTIKEDILESIKNKDFIVGLKKKKVLKAVYIFKINEDDNSLEFYKSYNTKDVSKEMLEEFEENVLNVLRKKISMEDIKKIKWYDIDINSKKIDAFSNSSFMLFFGLGLVYGLFFNNLLIGVILGLLMGSTCGIIIKRKR